MKKIFLSLLMAVAAGNLLAQKTIQDENVEKRTVSSFHGIDVATGIKLVLTEGPVEEVAVSASKAEYRDKIVTKVENGILKIHYETRTGAINRKKENKDLRAYVSYKMLDRLDVTTGARVELDGVLKSGRLDMKANTGAIVKGEIAITDLRVKQNTGSVVTLKGKSDIIDVDGDTGSIFEGEGLKVSNCTASASTGASVTITVQKELNAKADTGGSIRYRGEGGVLKAKTNTGGSVAKI